MTIFPITPLVRHVQGLIIQAFEVSEKQAEHYAAELVALAEGWGSPEVAAQLNWAYRIRKDLGEARKLRWRSEADREEFQRGEQLKYNEWDAIIRGNRHGGDGIEPFGTFRS